MVEEVSPEHLEAVLDSEERLVLVEAWAPWCAPCRDLRPRLNELAQRCAATCRVVAIDVDAHPDLAARLAVEAVPALLFFKKGELVHRLTGGALSPAMEAWLENR